MNPIAAKLFYAADAHLREVSLSLMPAKWEPVILDCGCGDCQFTNMMVHKLNPVKVLAIDSSEKRRQYAGEKNWLPIDADLNYPIPLADNQVDIIHAGQILEHLNDTDTFIKEIKRILKPKGYAVISTPNLASWHNILSLCIGRQPYTAMVSDEIPVSELPEDENMPKHRRIFTPHGLVKLFKYHGLKVTAVKGAGYYPFWGWLQRDLADLNPGKAVYTVVRVRKNGT